MNDWEASWWGYEGGGFLDCILNSGVCLFLRGRIYIVSMPVQDLWHTRPFTCVPALKDNGYVYIQQPSSLYGRPW